MESKMNCDSSSPFSGSDFDTESDDLEFRFFSSSSSSFLSSSSSSYFSDDDFGDIWSESSFSFESDDNISLENTNGATTLQSKNKSALGLLNEQNKVRDAILSETTGKEEEKKTNISIKITIDKEDSTKSVCRYIHDGNLDHTVSKLKNYRNTQQITQDKSSSDKIADAYSHANNYNDPFCDFCGEVFNSQAALDVHKLNHLVSESYTCELCDHVSKNREDYVLHSRTHDQNRVVLTGTLNKKKSHLNVPFHCETCSKAFRFSSSYKRHLARHTKSHTCNICNASFPTLILCHQHKLKHAKKRIHACNVCGKTFQRAHQLTIHMQVHESEKKYECVECGTTYCYKTSLMRHSLKYHSPNSPKFQCDVCGELFKSKKMLNGHTILHTATKLIECPECTQTFKYRSSYHRHRLIHQSTKPFRCSHCGKLFKSESLLKSHKAMHFTKDEFVCKVCDKTFAVESFLNKHMLTHKNNASYKNVSDQSE